MPRHPDPLTMGQRGLGDEGLAENASTFTNGKQRLSEVY